MKNSWSNVSGELAIELYGNDGEAVDTIFDADDDQPVPAITPDMVPKIKEDSYDLVIEFLSSGYFIPFGWIAIFWCVPSRAYLIHYVRVSDNVPRKIDSQEIELSPEKMNELFDHFQTRIEEVELEQPWYED